MRLVIRKSALLELAKGMNEDSFEKIKAAIIAHLKGLEEQEESGDLKKAITYFSDNESMFSHLEKSLSGEWIEKAGYGIGTVRTWRGKKYKKIAQGKWVRVYDKIDRGAKNAMTRLIHQAEKIDTPEEMMQFVLANKQRFSDANGKPLDIVDRLNALVDNKEYKNESSKKPASNTNKKTPAQPKTGKNTEKPAKTSGGNSFGLDDIKSGKKVKTVAEMEDVAKQIADKYKGNNPKAESVWIDFMAYNLDGGMGGDLATDFMQKHGDVNFQTLIKKLSGKKLSARERNPEFADEYANVEEEKNFPKQKTKEQNLSDEKYSKYDKIASTTDYTKKPVIAEPVSQGGDKVEYRKDKDTKVQFERLLKCCSNKNRYHMNFPYYDKENGVIVATDAQAMKVLKVGNLDIPGGYVVIDTKGKNISVTPDAESHGIFPPWKKVIPSDGNMDRGNRISLDNKALTEKIKEMKQNGSFGNKDNNFGAVLEARGGKVLLDGTEVGRTSGTDKTIRINQDHLTNCLSSGETSDLFFRDKKENGVMQIGDTNSVNIFLPMREPEKDPKEVYEENRAEAKLLKDKKDKNLAEPSKVEKPAKEKNVSKQAEQKEKTSAFKKEDFKSMSDAELKDYEAKLAKELLASNRGEPGYSEKYSHWQEVHRENNDRFHRNIADEAKAEKQREEEIKAEKEKEIKEKYNGYFDNIKGLGRARAIKNLEKKYRYEDKVMSRKEFVEQAIDNGAEIKEREVNKLDYPSRVRWNRMAGYEQQQYAKRVEAAGKKTAYYIDGYEFPKDVADYARFYKEKGKSSRLKEMQVKKSDSLYDYVQKSIAALKECRAI